jgi:transglutaminase-like putative cysteine protease
MTRREFIRLGTTATLVGLSPWPGKVWSAVHQDSQVEEMVAEIFFAAQFTTFPRDGRTLRVWLPVPPAKPDQRLEGFEVVSPLPWKRGREARRGNEFVFLETTPPFEPFTAGLRFRVHRRQSRRRPATLSAAEQQLFLSYPQRVRVSPPIAAFCAKVVGAEKDPEKVARKIYNALLEYLYYDKTIPGCGSGDAEWTFEHRRGKCDDFHSLLMALMLHQHIPVNWQQGFPLPYPSKLDAALEGTMQGDCTGAHCWAEFYAAGAGWVPLDLSEAWKRADLRDFYFGRLVPNRFLVSEGRDLVLDPPQGGEALNSFYFPYAECDGIPLIYGADYENKITYRILRIS